MPTIEPYRHNIDYAQMISSRLLVLRQSHGYTQEQVANLAGIATYTYQKYEYGFSKPNTPLNPQLLTLVSLADVYNIKLTDLLDPDIDFDSLAAE